MKLHKWQVLDTKLTIIIVKIKVNQGKKIKKLDMMTFLNFVYMSTP